MSDNTSDLTAMNMPSTNKMVLAGAAALTLSILMAAGQGGTENWKALKLMEIRGQMADRVQHRGWNVCLVKPPQGDAREILLANLPYDSRKAFDAWQANQSPGPALEHLENEVAQRRSDYVSAINSGAPDQIDAATKTLEAAKDQLAHMRDLSSTDAKDEGFSIRARPTGQTYDSLEIWDCGSQKELDAAYAQALKARKDQDSRMAEAKERLKADQELAAKNDPDGIFKMAERYYLGDRLAGISRDPAKARALYEKAAAMGHADAAIALKHFPPSNSSAR